MQQLRLLQHQLLLWATDLRLPSFQGRPVATVEAAQVQGIQREKMTEVIVCTIGELKRTRCKDCNALISFGATYCTKCAGKHRRNS